MKNVFKILGVIALVAVIGFGVISCGGDDDKGGGGTTVAVTGVTLAPKTLSLTVGGATGTLTATVAPNDATNKAVTWSTSNAGVATVTNGTVTAVAAGTATITVTTADGSKTDTCAVTVTPVGPATANVSIEIEAQYYGTGADATHYVVIYLSLASGAKWTLPETGDYRTITDAQALAAVKSWVTITSSTTPAITGTGWDFDAWYEDDSKIALGYDKDGTGVSRSAVTATIDTTKLSEMKSKTNVTGTLTASPGTATVNSWTNLDDN